jgi:uncharacterized protein GlcG (DUF336 family)
MRHVFVVFIALFAIACDRAHGRAGTPGYQPGTADERDEAPGQRAGRCSDLPSDDDLRRLLRDSANTAEMGGLNSAKFEWAAVVNRKGELCSVAVSTDDQTAAWPGSQAIAKAKAYTANAFSTDLVPLSTARLYTLAQPGHSLFGAGAANPFNPQCLAAPDGDHTKGPKICGGTIVFGGGVPLYKGKTRIGGLGASGDTACADHEIAKRMREKAGLNPPTGAAADDIVYSKIDGPSPFGHPLCQNTWRNGKKLGEEAPASGY